MSSCEEIEEAHAGATAGRARRLSKIWPSRHTSTSASKRQPSNEKMSDRQAGHTPALDSGSQASPVLNLFERTGSLDLPGISPLEKDSLASPMLNIISKAPIRGNLRSENKKEKMRGLNRGIQYLKRSKRNHEATGNWQEAQVAKEAIEKKESKLKSLKDIPTNTRYDPQQRRKSSFWSLGRKKSADVGAHEASPHPERAQTAGEQEARVLENLVMMGLLNAKTPTTPSPVRSPSRKRHSSARYSQTGGAAGTRDTFNDKPSTPRMAESSLRSPEELNQASNSATIPSTIGEDPVPTLKHEPSPEDLHRLATTEPELQPPAASSLAAGSKQSHRYSQSLSSHPVSASPGVGQSQDQIKALQSERDYWRRRAEPRKSIMPVSEVSLGGDGDDALQEILRLRLRVHELEQEVIRGR